MCWTHWFHQSVTPCGDQPQGSCLHYILSPSRGGSLLSRNSLYHGAGVEYRFPLEVRGRGGRRRSPKGAVRSDFVGLESWQVVMCLRCTRRRWFHAEVVASGTSTINRIVLRFLCSKTYRTILSLRRSFVGKHNDNQPSWRYGVGRVIQAACGPKRWDRPDSPSKGTYSGCSMWS